MTSKKPSTRNLLDSMIAGWKNSRMTRYAMFVLLFVVLYVSLAPNLLPQRFDIQVGTVSDSDIIAPMQIPNNKSTLQAQEAAAEQVESVYAIVSMRRETVISQMLDRIESLNQDDQITNADKAQIYSEEIPQRAQNSIANFIRNNREAGKYSDKMLDEMQKTIGEQTYSIPEETFLKIPRLSTDEIQDMRQVATSIMSRLMSDQITDAQSARAKVAELVSTSSLNSRTAREVVQELVRATLTANKFYDEEATRAAKVEARENTPTVYIQQGEVLVPKGEKITQEMYTLLDENDLLKNDVNYWPQLGLVLFAFLITLGLYMYLRQSIHQGRSYNNSQLLMLIVIFVIGVICLHLVRILQIGNSPYFGFLVPAAIVVMLITLLLDIQLAYISSIIMSILASIILNMSQHELFDYQFGFFTLVVSFTAIQCIHRASQRSTILKAGIMSCFFGAIAVLTLVLLNDGEWTRMSMMYAVGFACIGGLITTVLVLGLMPFFETTFGILSALKLVELSNPNHPLLRKLLIETPGTYHHSVMVGNLSEAAAEAIGADGLLCRVGSYYHDIGKTKRPGYFIENQNNIGNPHDSIDPKLSKSIIIAHARDGVEMQKEYKLPKPIRDIAEQHHGTTFLHYFYHKALKLAEEQEIEPDFTENDFRYPGPKAQTKEAAVVGIADSVEAAVRSLSKPTVEQVETMIEKIIKGRVDDNQFNECDLTMKELDVVARTLKEAVMGIFHSRIEYPEDIKKPDQKENKA
ncbi:HDIG domain-containing protein [Paenibacillus sp. PsM32]|uniref:HDIG domain-containing protein n=1 Tax=Paenibacillus kyungheensis TaxID=1452732 RepID=A0AAX3LYS8_9BACL|nr:MULTISPECIES: HDIG domain-containing metalloprotein [Paenibacillus]MDN4620504.1 HDIG domain-containing protein [Paenibacillus sp. PsM32]MDQ1235046.1 putative nucleotidyltransferase with HDIG domain [Paenibacillus sp. SORGH_AS_0306]MDR6112094.1 putative nucleotidyltransferase with HDIG domain [Paenibacillus sp. SORGH_AS_0338]WCT54616.1 HDIG domain-containing protein [Paenibacillus kyungheensis]